jgi:hypothetical protein
MVTLVTIHSLDKRRTHFDQAGIYAALGELSRELRLEDHWEGRRGGYAPRRFEESEHRGYPLDANHGSKGRHSSPAPLRTTPVCPSDCPARVWK